ncbi:MAG: NIL domain-containing protein [Eubacteriaceae bacterium]
MKKKVLLNFPRKLTGKPLTFNLIKKYELEINILKASIDYSIEGSLLLEINGIEENILMGIDYLKNNGVEVNVIENPININFDECVQCGTCVAACSVNALYMDHQWKLEYDANLCMECMLCIKACPLRLIVSEV